MKPSDFKIGQEVFVYRDRSTSGLESMFVVSIGRRWVGLSSERGGWECKKFDPKQTASVWLSMEHFVKSQELDKAWRDFRTEVSNCYHRPNVPLENIEQAKRLLFGDAK